MVARKTAPRRATNETRARGNGAARRLERSGEKPETLIEYYRLMFLSRRFEERTGEMYTRAKIGGYCHLNLGEEATVVGLMALHWICEVCGEQTRGEQRPESCPKCGATGSRFRQEAVQPGM